MKEIESLADLNAHLAGGGLWSGLAFQSVDLTAYSEQLCSADLTGSLFLGCPMEASALHHAIASGALVFPELPGLPFKPYRSELYSVHELYQGFDRARPETYLVTPDACIYRHWKNSGGSETETLFETLSHRLHDHAITDAMIREIRGLKLAAIMGGHSMPRTRGDYLTVAIIARELSLEGITVVTGGGPGAMEAGHLGAFLARAPLSLLEDAVDVLAEAPRYDDPLWLSRAFDVRERFGDTHEIPSIGIPTWHYGHEPPNAFATQHAKYFANSVREEGLLTIAKHGIIFAPGSAGTIQEIFQENCQNRYNTVGIISPMVFFGDAYWHWKRPVWPLIAQLAAGHEYARFLTISDDITTIVRAITDFDPSEQTGRAGGG